MVADDNAQYEQCRRRTKRDVFQGLKLGAGTIVNATHSNPPDGPKEQCLGMPIFDVDARVVDPATLQELPQGQTCEIMVHGPQVLQGYWKQPDATEQAFVQIDGKRFLHTGEVSEQQMVGWSREHMAAHKSPRIVQFADSLPTSGTGKVMWRALQDAEDAAGT